MKNRVILRVKQFIGHILYILAILIIIISEAGCSESTDTSMDNHDSESFHSPSWIDEDDLVIDANVGLGRFANGAGAEYQVIEDALKRLKSGKVKAAVIYSVLSRETDAEEGNKIVLEECAKHPEFIPSAVLNPFEMNIDTALSQMQKYNIRLVKLFPLKGRYTVHPSIIGSVVEKLQDAGKVLFLDFEPHHWSINSNDYNAVYELCKAYPHIPVILGGPTITGTRNYPGILSDCDNFFLEISQIIEPEEIVDLVRKGYGKRLIFGSGFPLRDPGPLVDMLANSGLTDQELRDICSNNLLQLLKYKPANGAFTLKPPVKRQIVDLHVHLGKINPVPSGTQDADGIYRNMERCGIDAVVASSLWGCFGEVKRGNKAVSEACLKYPGRIFGYITLDPKYPEEVKSQLELYGDDPAFVGIKLHELHQVELTDSLHDMIFAFADKKGWPCLVHAEMVPERWERVCRKYKNANFIMAHFGGEDPSNKAIFKLAKLARELKNLYFDCSHDAMVPGSLERLAGIAGAEQIVYGSDFPMFDFTYESSRITSTTLTENEKNLILFGNAKKLLRF